MTRTDNFDEILNGIHDDVIRNYCRTIIKHVAEYLVSSSERHPVWTYRTLSNWVNADIEDERLHRSISLLSSSLAPLLERHYLWLSNDDDGLLRVDDEFVRNALVSNLAEDPDTGELVTNPREHLVPYFAPLIPGGPRE